MLRMLLMIALVSFPAFVHAADGCDVALRVLGEQQRQGAANMAKQIGELYEKVTHLKRMNVKLTRQLKAYKKTTGDDKVYPGLEGKP